MTLEDVAREAGVSVSTASRTLNGKPAKVGAATQARVRAAAQALGYATNLAAQATALGRSKSIGLVVSTIPEDYQNPVTAGLFRSAGNRDLLVSTGISALTDVDKTRQVVRQLRGQRPSVIFVVGTEPADSPGMAELIEELNWAEREGSRVVLIGVRGTNLDSVVMDDHRAGGDMARALIEVGYTEFAVIAGTAPGLLSKHRVAGFREAVLEEGLPFTPDRVIWQEFTHDGGYRAVGELLRRRDGINAVFCVNDAMAIGAAVRMREAGLTIGADIALAGCDDIPALRDIDPPMSSMHLPWTEAAEEAFALAEYPESDGRTVVLEGHAVLRRSTPGLVSR
ncbi:LacI family DNA-binding transcriptional regulator [Leifsonia shinshuensis]|uniref:LacI family DNA-binding transcriptional regulator n=1 Tax=Leifsonia shinshuensis TaxID=150026 RepID=UPI001628D565|nr:LacI family DNA-binding transcriptional regulator [Leifsonia shinshuensis]